MGARTASILLCLVLAGCSTGVDLLKLQRQQLLDIEKAAVKIDSYAAASHFEPGRYDMYLFLNGGKFNNILQAFDGLKFETEAGGRPLEFTLGEVRTAFRPGYPVMTVKASARDLRSGIAANVELDARWLVESDPQVPDKLYLRLVATRIVPDLSWGPFNLARWRFARQLMQLEATKLTRRLPPVEIPIEQKFEFGNEAGFVDLNGLPTGEGSMDGRLSYPSTKIAGAVRVCHVLFLRNGIHVFADVEGLGIGERICDRQIL